MMNMMSITKIMKMGFHDRLLLSPAFSPKRFASCSILFSFSIFLYFFLHLPLANSTLHSQNSWQKLTIPGAKCGNGSPYHVFIRPGSYQKLALSFMEGGACWDRATCIGPTPHTYLGQIPFVKPMNGLYSVDPKKNELADYTHIYFTYCTGDVFVGNHRALYKDKEVFHFGRKNIETALLYLTEKQFVAWENLEHVVLFGFSAGALGALLHVGTVEPYLHPLTQRTLISDSPGLHFGENFWNKFSEDFKQDVKEAFQHLGMTFEAETGNLAPQIKNFCQLYSHWSMGILQASQDFIMSQVFGNLSPKKHEELLLGPQGLFQLTQKAEDNCSMWVPKSISHIFLMTDTTSRTTVAGKRAIDFANDIIRRIDRKSYTFSRK